MLPIIQRRYPQAYQKPFHEGVFLDGDIIIPEIGEMMEIKTDYQQPIYRNIAIEVSCMGHPSGLKATKSKWWTIINEYRKYWLATPDQIWKMINDNIHKEDVVWIEGKEVVLSKAIRHEPTFTNPTTYQSLDMYFIPTVIFEHYCMAYGALEDFPLNLIV